MNRCLSYFLPHPMRQGFSMCAMALLVAASPATVQAQTQVPAGLGSARNFPEAALRGKLIIGNGSEATINGNPIRMAPGMRLFNPQNGLVMLNTVVGQSFTVNYLIEHSTGMLLSAWILTRGEADQPRKGSDGVTMNIRTESDKVPTR